MAKKEYPKQRIVADIKALDASIPVPIPDAPNANKIAVAPRDAVLDFNIPDGGTTSTAIRAVPNPVLSFEIPDAPNASVVTTTSIPALKSDIPDAGILARVQMPVKSSEIDTTIPDTPNSTVITVVPNPAQLSTDIPDAPNKTTIIAAPRIAELSTDIPDGGNATVVKMAVQNPELSTDIPDAGTLARIQIPAKPVDIQTDIPDGGMLQRVQTPIKSPELGNDIPDGGVLTRVQTPRPSPEMKFDIPDPGEIGTEHRREFTFSKSEWEPDDDALNISPDNLATLQNFRYIDRGIEGAGGFSRINTDGTGKYIRSAIQLRTPYDQESYIIAQGADSDGTDRILMKHLSSIPDAGNFEGYTTTTFVVQRSLQLYATYGGTPSPYITLYISAGTYTGTSLAAAIQTAINLNTALTFGGLIAYTCVYSSNKYTIEATGTGLSAEVAYIQTGSTISSYIGFTTNQDPAASITSDTEVVYQLALYTEDAAAGLARFSPLPNGNMGMCDGKANKIWAGDEMPVGAFLIGTEPTVDIAATNVRLVFVHSTEGSKNIDLTVGTYTATELAAELETKLNAAFTATFVVTNRLGKMHIAVSSGTIQYTYNSGVGYAGEPCGFLADTAAATSITSQTYYAGAPFLKNLKDVTKEINSTEISLSQTVLGIDAHQFFLIGATRPILSMNFTKQFTTGSPDNLLIYYFDGTSFVLNTQVSDTTSDLEDPGTVTLTDTTALAKPMLVNGYYLYFYYGTIDSGIAYLKNATVNCPISGIIDIWGGEYLTARKVLFVDDGNKKDYTLDLSENTQRAYKDDGTASNYGVLPLAEMGGANEYIELLFAFPMCGFLWDIANASTGTAEKMIVSYWDGDSYVEAVNVYDSLKNGDQVDIDGAGTYKWSNYYFGTGGGYQFFTAGTTLVPEVKSEINNIKGYRYKVEWDDDLTSLTVDRIVGVQKYQKIYDTYTFPFQYRTRALWVGCISDSELNRVDYSMTNAPDVYNGDDSSKYDNSQSLRFGGKDALTGAAELFNQYGLNLASGALFFKNAETYLLTGSTPTGDDAFKIHKISGQIGCPAPLTITNAEVSFTHGDQPPANIVLWLSDKGPMMYYNTSIYSIPGVRSYFDPARTDICINTAYLDRAAAWYDPQYREWNLVFPSVAGATALCDTWLVFDLVRKRWWKRVTANTADFPQGGFLVEDTDGNKYVYCFTASGYLLRMENGLLDVTYGITNTLKTADILPNQSMWDRTKIPTMKALYVDNAKGSLAINYYADGVTTATSAIQAAVAANMNGSNRYVNLKKKVYGTVTGTGEKYHISALSHAFEFICTTCTATKPRLLGWGFQYLLDMEDTTAS